MGDLLSSPAFIGGLIGLAIGLGQYGVLVRAVFPHIERAQAERHAAEGRPADRSLGLVKGVILVSDLIIFPLIGYVAGPLVASALGLGGAT